MNPTETLIQVVKTFIGTSDASPFLKDSDLPRGSAWCAAFIQFCIHRVEAITGIKSPIYDSDLVMKIWSASPKELRSSVPIPGNIVVWERGGSIEGHTGLVILGADKYYRTIEGNSSNPKAPSNPRGVYEHLHTLSPGPPLRLKLLGFLTPFSTADHSH